MSAPESEYSRQARELHSIWAGRALKRIAQTPSLGACLLICLCFLTYLPGVLRLPPVDRTEVIFAHTSHDMATQGTWLDPKYGKDVDPFHPIGTHWLQAVSAKAYAALSGEDNPLWIAIYRVPSFLAVTGAVVAMFYLAIPLFGVPSALLAACFFAVSPLTVLVATLAIADGLALASATISLMCLFRIYAGAPQDTPALASLFWAAVGSGILVNALHVPALIAVVVVAVIACDRDTTWIKRTYPAIGIPFALALGAPWLIVRFLQDGGMPYQGLPFGDAISALLGAQNMKLRALPGTFVLAAFLGFLPAIAVIADAMLRVWATKSEKISKFLLCWIGPWLFFLELVSDKPATYSVQVLFPAFALAAAGLILQPSAQTNKLPFSIIPSVPVALCLTCALLLAPFAVAGEWPSIMVVAVTILVAVLAALAGRATSLRGWSVFAITTFALYAAILLGLVLPSIEKVWPARELNRAIADCGGAPIWVLGFREPSGAFTLDIDKSYIPLHEIPTERSRLHVVESRWIERYRTETAKRGMKPVELACVEAYNVMRGCALTFTLFEIGDEPRSCTVRSAQSCSRVKDRARPASAVCD